MSTKLNLTKPWYIAIPELFEQCHVEKIVSDGKAIADATPNTHIDDIKQSYYSLKSSKHFNLKEFFTTFFTLPVSPSVDFIADTSRPLEEHIKALWPILSRNPQKQIPNSSLLALPKKYIVPGGRFTEIYYWDSYFTMLGLKIHKEMDLIESMIDNFTYMIDTIGYIPNGNRAYYLGRSQPPFYSHMVELLANIKGETVYKTYATALENEYFYWMEVGNKKLVRISDKLALNRYYDINMTPRPEMHQEDIELAHEIENTSLFYNNIRAACESGWDFSSRWFVNEDDIGTIITTALLPVDLNCLLYHLEMTLSKAFNDDEVKGKEYLLAANTRKKHINELMWSEALSCYVDYNFVLSEQSDRITAAACFPLFVNIASQDQADKVSKTLEEKLLKDGGIVTTEFTTGQQWDAPNGWAPLQWVAYKGLQNYGHYDLADKIKNAWLTLNEKVYQSTGKMMEKYNVEDMSLDAGGGEYPVQDGFGWSNGVYVAMKNEE